MSEIISTLTVIVLPLLESIISLNLMLNKMKIMQNHVNQTRNWMNWMTLMFLFAISWYFGVILIGGHLLDRGRLLERAV